MTTITVRTYPVHEAIKGAFVVPGPGWKYHNQNGNSTYGIVTGDEVPLAFDTYASVLWENDKITRSYRIKNHADLYYHPDFAEVVYEWSKNRFIKPRDFDHERKGPSFFVAYHTLTLIQLFVNEFSTEEILNFIELHKLRKQVVYASESQHNL